MGVRVVHGANDETLPLGGRTVAFVAHSLRDVFNIPLDADAYVNGVRVESDFVIQEGHLVEWVREWGKKGIGDVCTRATFQSCFDVTDEEWRSCKEHGMATGKVHHIEVLLVDEGASILRVVRAAERLPSIKLSSNEKAVMSALGSGVSMSGAELSQTTGIGIQTLKPLLAALVRHGIISKSATGYSGL